IFTQFCVVVFSSTLLSLLTSFTIVPLLSSRFGKLEHITNDTFFGRIILDFEKQLHRCTNWITNMLKWCLAHKKTALGVTFGLLIASFALLGTGYIGAEFFPKSDKGEFMVQIELPKDASIEVTNQVTRKAEEFLSTKKEITSLITTVGQSSEGMGGSLATSYKSEIN